MSIPLLSILNRLKSENLHGPISKPFGDAASPNVTSEQNELDSQDPRWFEMFMEYFINADSKVSDDLLFFARKYVPPRRSSTGSINEREAVLVRRRIPGQAPALNDVINWKQSFFLNLICQQPCTLTASICTRFGGEKRMVALKRVTRKVFAQPYKSRMDVKDAVMNECSYPLVYYTINDFESDVLHLPIFPDEYLCVELAVVVPTRPEPNSDGYLNAADNVASISVKDDDDPFPIPKGYDKVVLFQGAVSFQALSAVYQQKGTTHLGNDDPRVHRTEYIQMKGPHGNGQCQGKSH